VNVLVLHFAWKLALLAIRARERANAPSGAAVKAAVTTIWPLQPVSTDP
jgi:hypothetical protein